MLSYVAEGDFYTLVKNWDLSDSVVKPNSKLEQARAAKGKAALAGLPENQISSSLEPLLMTAYQ